MRTRIVATLAACLLATACSGDTADDGDVTDADDGAASGGAVVTIADFDFGEIPSVAAGATLTVENSDSAPHTFTAADGTFDTGSVDAGGSATVTVDEPGDYDVACTIHPSMTGTLTVTG